jgi:hypothetical protein
MATDLLRRNPGVFRKLYAVNHQLHYSRFCSPNGAIGDNGLHFVRRLSSGRDPNDEYDYIVVGAGSAGCVVANRLVLGDHKARVLLTEAGPPGDQSLFVRMPAGLVFVMLNKKIAWHHETSPQVRQQILLLGQLYRDVCPSVASRLKTLHEGRPYSENQDFIGFQPTEITDPYMSTL